MNVKLLSIETSTEACSAALLVDNEIIDRFEVAPRKHNELILPMCEQVLAEGGVSRNELDAIAFGCGPGAFTGVRIAASVTQGIAIAYELPVIPVSTLENLASQADAGAGEFILPAIDARMDEIYWAIFQKNSNNRLILHLPEQVQEPEKIEHLGVEVCHALGSGWGAYEAILRKKIRINSSNISSNALPRASNAAELAKVKFLDGEMVNAENALPVYLRNNVVHRN